MDKPLRSKLKGNKEKKINWKIKKKNGNSGKKGCILKHCSQTAFCHCGCPSRSSFFFPRAHVSVGPVLLPAPRGHLRHQLVSEIVVDSCVCATEKSRWRLEVLLFPEIIRTHLAWLCCFSLEGRCLVSSPCCLNAITCFLPAIKDSSTPGSPRIPHLGNFMSS